MDKLLKELREAVAEKNWRLLMSHKYEQSMAQQGWGEKELTADYTFNMHRMLVFRAGENIQNIAERIAEEWE